MECAKSEIALFIEKLNQERKEMKGEFERAISLDYTNPEKAFEIYQKLYEKTKLDPFDRASVLGQMGVLYAKNGDYAIALMYSRRALRVYPLLDGVKENIEKIYSHLGMKNERTEDPYLDENDPLLLIEIALNLNLEEQYKESIKYIDKAISLDPHNDYAWLIRSGPLLDLNMIEEAKRSLERCLRINPNNQEAKEQMEYFRDEFSKVKTEYSKKRLKRRKKKMGENEKANQMNPYMRKIFQGLWFAFGYNSPLTKPEEEEPDWEIEE